MKHRDYEFDDDEVFDRRYYPKLVYKDGYGPHVSLMLTDAMRREVATHAPLLHRPGSVTLTDAQIDVRERARAERSARIKDAWRGSAMAPDDDDVFALATRIAPLLGLAPPKANATRSPMDGQPPADPDPDPRAAAEAALADRARRKSQAWKTSWSARR
jgi:hypothetical protein